MSTSARDDRLADTAEPSQPRVLTSVAAPLEHAAALVPGPDGDPDVGRAATLGAVAGFLVATMVVAAGGMAAGLEVGSALALGVFVGSFGGAGFGFMVAASILLARADARATSARPYPTPRTARNDKETTT